MALLTHATLSRLAAHLHEELAGTKVQKIRAMGPGDFVFELYGDSTRSNLRVQARPGAYRLYLLDERPTGGAGVTPGRPESMLMCLRKHLTPSRLTKVHVDPLDRVLTLAFSTPSGIFSMVLKAYSTRPNLFMADPSGRVLAAAYGGIGDYPTGAPSKALGQPKSRDPFAGLEGAALNAAVAAAQDGAEGVKDSQSSRTSQRRPLARQIKRTKRRIERLNKDVEQAGDPDILRAHAQLLATALHKLARGLDQVTLENPGIEGLDAMVTIPLLPKLSPKENMEQKFKKARRAQRTRVHVARERVLLEQELALRTQQIEQLDAGETPDLEMTPLPQAKSQRQKKPIAKDSSQDKALARLAHIHHTDCDARILVGKNAKANDTLLRRYAKGNDLWFHVRDGQGSHVFLRPSGSTASAAAMDLAASLAARYSSLKSEAKVDVIWTQCKHVRKRKGTPAGQVQVSTTRNMRVTPA